MKGKSPKDSKVEMTELVLPQHTNSLGTIFGGVILSGLILLQLLQLKNIVKKW